MEKHMSRVKYDDDEAYNQILIQIVKMRKRKRMRRRMNKKKVFCFVSSCDQCGDRLQKKKRWDDKR
jgi:hypothetical protein